MHLGTLLAREPQSPAFTCWTMIRCLLALALSRKLLFYSSGGSSEPRRMPFPPFRLQRSIGKLRTLSGLGLRHVDLSSISSLEGLSPLTQLKVLSLSGCAKLHTRSAEVSFHNRPQKHVCVR